jgi:DNA-binding transcriptional regulator LsrR (DeoR family)
VRRENVPSLQELRLLTRVASLYYEHGLAQAEIGKRLDLSQAKVSRLLKRAQQEQIVRITVSTPMGVFSDLEEEIQSRYGLRDVIIGDCADEAENDILQSIGASAAYYLENTLRAGEVIGISSWSATLLAMVNRLHPFTKMRDVRVVQILGGMGNPTAETHASRMIHRLAELVHGAAVFLPAPGVATSPSARKAYLQDPYVKEAVETFDDVTLALVGIGALEPSHLLASSGNVFSDKELKLLEDRGVVGDICLRFFDAAGKLVSSPLNNRVTGMTLEGMKKVKRVVGIAGGKRKTAAIRAALEGRLIDVLITDRFTAERILKGGN